MSDYKRFTIRNDDGTWSVNYLELADEVAKWQEQHATQYLSTDLTNILGEKLAELEDKIENGTLKFMPCKVGDTVYRVVNDKRVKRPQEFKVTGFWCSTYKNCGEIHLAHYIDNRFIGSITVPFSEFNKMLFLTKPEAEAKLGELQGEKQ